MSCQIQFLTTYIEIKSCLWNVLTSQKCLKNEPLNLSAHSRPPENGYTFYTHVLRSSPQHHKTPALSSLLWIRCHTLVYYIYIKVTDLHNFVLKLFFLHCWTTFKKLDSFVIFLNLKCFYNLRLFDCYKIGIFWHLRSFFIF